MVDCEVQSDAFAVDFVVFASSREVEDVFALIGAPTTDVAGTIAVVADWVAGSGERAIGRQQRVLESCEDSTIVQWTAARVVESVHEHELLFRYLRLPESRGAKLTFAVELDRRAQRFLRDLADLAGDVELAKAAEAVTGQLAMPAANAVALIAESFAAATWRFQIMQSMVAILETVRPATARKWAKRHCIRTKISFDRQVGVFWCL